MGSPADQEHCQKIAKGKPKVKSSQTEQVVSDSISISTRRDLKLVAGLKFKFEGTLIKTFR